LENTRHAGDGLPLRQFFAYEKRQDKIMGGELRLADEVAHASAAAQTSRALNQFSHGPRLAVAPECRKFAAGRIRPLVDPPGELDVVCGSGVNGFHGCAPLRNE
jgi:hypothetical protein